MYNVRKMVKHTLKIMHNRVKDFKWQIIPNMFGKIHNAIVQDQFCIKKQNGMLVIKSFYFHWWKHFYCQSTNDTRLLIRLLIQNNCVVKKAMESAQFQS